MEHIKRKKILMQTVKIAGKNDIKLYNEEKIKWRRRGLRVNIKCKRKEYRSV